jgi:hypothetical protein
LVAGCCSGLFFILCMGIRKAGSRSSRELLS